MRALFQPFGGGHGTPHELCSGPSTVRRLFRLNLLQCWHLFISPGESTERRACAGGAARHRAHPGLRVVGRDVPAEPPTPAVGRSADELRYGASRRHRRGPVQPERTLDACSEPEPRRWSPCAFAWDGASQRAMDEGADRKGRRPTGSSSSCSTAAVRPVHWTGCQLPGTSHLGKRGRSWAICAAETEEWTGRPRLRRGRNWPLLSAVSVVSWRSILCFCARWEATPPGTSSFWVVG
jgi:hypothetical protein